MIYSLVQHLLRASLKSSNKSIPNPSGNSTKNPSARWVFHYFHGIQVVAHYQDLMIHLTPLLEPITKSFGPSAGATYAISISKQAKKY